MTALPEASVSAMTKAAMRATSLSFKVSKMAKHFDGGFVVAATATGNARTVRRPLEGRGEKRLDLLGLVGKGRLRRALGEAFANRIGADTGMIGADPPIAAGGNGMGDHQAQRIGGAGYDGQPHHGMAVQVEIGLHRLGDGGAGGASLPSFSALAFALARLSFFSASRNSRAVT